MKDVQAWVTLVTAIIVGIMVAVLPVGILIAKLVQAKRNGDSILEVLTGYQAEIEKKKREATPMGKFAKTFGKVLGATTQMMTAPAQRIAEDVNAVVDPNKSESTTDRKRARRRAIVGGIFRAVTGR